LHQYCLNLRYYSREDTEDAVKYISGTILDDRPIRVDFDWGFLEGRQWGRGRSGGQVCCFHSLLSLCVSIFALLVISLFSVIQVRDEYRTDYDPDILLSLLLSIIAWVLHCLQGICH